MAPRPRIVQMLTLALVALVGGCTGGSASPTPAGSSALLQELTRAGFRIREAVAGDAGCSDETLAGNATRLRLDRPPVDSNVTLHLYIFRVRDYEAERDRLEACAAEMEAATGLVFDRIDVPPYSALVAGLGTSGKDALTRALESAARGGS